MIAGGHNAGVDDDCMVSVLKGGAWLSQEKLIMIFVVASERERETERGGGAVFLFTHEAAPSHPHYFNM